MQLPFDTVLRKPVIYNDAANDTITRVALSVWALLDRPDATVGHILDQCEAANVGIGTVSAVYRVIYWLALDDISILPNTMTAVMQLMAISVMQLRSVTRVWQQAEMNTNTLDQLYQSTVDTIGPRCRPPSGSFPIHRSLHLPEVHPIVAAVGAGLASKETTQPLALHFLMVDACLGWKHILKGMKCGRREGFVPGTYVCWNHEPKPAIHPRTVLLKQPLQEMHDLAGLCDMKAKSPDWMLARRARNVLHDASTTAGRSLSGATFTPGVWSPTPMTGNHSDEGNSIQKLFDNRASAWRLDHQANANPHMLFVNTLAFAWATPEMRYTHELMVARALYTFFAYSGLDVLLLVPLLSGDYGIRNLDAINGSIIRVCRQSPLFNKLTPAHQFTAPRPRDFTTIDNIDNNDSQLALVWLSRDRNPFPITLLADTTMLGTKHSGADERNPLFEYSNTTEEY
ncbi:hypothetical protein RI367_006520 [Sorochytrium milnesiophthora]